MHLAPYDRRAAVLYAHRWAYGRNPAFYDYENLGGDCTNFASQCIYVGSGVMNFTPTFGWYYIDANQKAPAWTGVPYLYNFLTREEQTAGPAARPCELADLHPGDLIQLSFNGTDFRHSPVVVSVGHPAAPENVLIAAHSYDADNRPLSTYDYLASGGHKEVDISRKIRYNSCITAMMRRSMRKCPVKRAPGMVERGEGCR